MSGQLEVVIEVPAGSRNKYEFDHVRGVFRLDRVLFSAVHYPTDYGFIPNTHAADGDHLDVLVLVHQPTFPGCHVLVRPIGVLYMSDDKGQDEKIIAVPVVDPRFDHVDDLGDLGAHWVKEIETFFRSYKVLEQKEVHLDGWGGVAEAWRVIRDATESVPAEEESVPAPSEAWEPSSAAGGHALF
jgi:inorganic pyrophosphatase